MKSIKLIFTCLMLIVSLTTMAVNTNDYVIDEGILMGDVNNDGLVSSVDVTALYNYLLDSDSSAIFNGDQDGDGIITSVDITIIYNILLNGGGGYSSGSELEMQDYFENSAQLSFIPKHQWVDGDVIYLAIDGDNSTTCKNVYAMVRNGGKWELNDVQGNSKEGFKTSGGTVDAVYVQRGNVAESYYNHIPITGDVACVNHSGTYTVYTKDNKFHITLKDLYFYHFVSRIDVYGANEGDYFYGSVTHLDALTKVSWFTMYDYDAFQTSDHAPIVNIDSSNKGYAYGVWEMGTRVNGWLTLNYAKSNGYAYFWNYGQDKLNQGRFLASIYSPWQNTWDRDISMRGYNNDTKESIRGNANSNTDTVRITVGTNIMFRAYNGDSVNTGGQILSATPSTSGIIDVNFSQPEQINVIAHKVGTTTLTIKHKTKDNFTATYTFNILVEPTLWIAGSVVENDTTKPMLWRNNQSKAMYLGGRDSYTSANKVIVRGSTAYVMLQRNITDTYLSPQSANAAIYKTTGAHGSGYYILYKGGIIGCSKQYGSNGNEKYYITAVPRMWVDKENNVYYTSAIRVNNTSTLDGYINTDVYKNNTILRTIANLLVNDIATDNTGNLFLVGMTSNYQCEGGTYYSMGDATADLAIIDANNNISITPWSHYLFNQLLVKDDTVYVNADGFYKMNENYIWNSYSNVFLRYTASTGLQLYTGQVSENGLSMEGTTTFMGTIIDHEPFAFDSNKFYYSGSSLAPIKTYQLDASETGVYTDYSSSTTPLKFDVNNGWIGMVLYNNNDKLYYPMCCKLNTYKSTSPLEDASNVKIYDVFLQTSLDD